MGTDVSGPVLLVLPSLGRGGAERVFVDLAAGLAEGGREVHLAWASGSGELAADLPPGVTPHPAGASRTATAVPAIRRLVTEIDPAVVLSALFHGNLLAAAAVRGRRHRPGLVFTEHVQLGSLPQRSSRRLLRWSPRLVPLAYRAADVVVAVSAGVADELVSVGRVPADRVRHIPNPVDFDRIDALAAVPADPALDGPGPLVVGVGRLVELKGFDLLVRAVAAMPESTRLVLVGDGPERVPLERLAGTLGVADRVRFTGALDNPYPVMARADVVVSPSRTEALPTVLIEAVHLGRPVVAADCSPGVREVLDQGAIGRLVEPDDVPAIAAAVRSALVDGGGPPPAAVSGYGRDEVVGRYDELIVEVSGRRSARPTVPSAG